MKFIVFLFALVLIVPSVMAAEQFRISFGNGYTLQTDNDSQCLENSYLEEGSQIFDFKIESNCANLPVEVEWVEIENYLGPIWDGEVLVGEDWFYVNSDARPDLDVPATITFNNPPFVVRPTVLKDGAECEGFDCNITSFTPEALVIEVSGFSNYSLSAAQQFTVYSDPNPELKKKTYQTVDLGDLYRNSTFTCTVQVFGKNVDDDTQWVLVQTNPTREIQSRMFGSPDTNQPESLGYFPVVNGMANTYFRGDNLYAYNDLQLVIQCADGNQKLVYEEAISTRYSPAGRAVVSRGIWLTDDNNAFFVIILAIGSILALWVGVNIWRKTFR